MKNKIQWEFRHIESVSIVDGCTLDAMIDLGFNIKIKERFLLRAYNAPEVGGPEKKRGQLAKARLIEIFSSENAPKIRETRIMSHKSDLFGRYLADIQLLLEVSDGGWRWVDLVEFLIKEGWGTCWEMRQEGFNFMSHPYPLPTGANHHQYRTRIMANTADEIEELS